MWLLRSEYGRDVLWHSWQDAADAAADREDDEVVQVIPLMEVTPELLAAIKMAIGLQWPMSPDGLAKKASCVGPSFTAEDCAERTTLRRFLDEAVRKSTPSVV